MVTKKEFNDLKNKVCNIKENIRKIKELERIKKKISTIFFFEALVVIIYFSLLIMFSLTNSKFLLYFLLIVFFVSIGLIIGKKKYCKNW